MDRRSFLGAGLTGLAAWATGRAQAPQGAQAQDPPAAQLDLQDQFDRPQSLMHHRGHVVVLLYGDRTGLAAGRGLGEKLGAQFRPDGGQTARDVHVIPVLCLGKLAGPLRNVIKNQVRKGSPDVPVWLDFENKTKAQFGLAADVPNVAVVDAAGRVRYRVAGQLDSAGYDRLVQVVAALRKEAAANR